jgi:hypothetical protein
MINGWQLGRLDCDGATCGQSQVCCWENSTMSCVDAQSCNGMQILCDEPADCPGQSCCIEVQQFHCVANCPGSGAEVCGSDQDCTGSMSNCCPYASNSSMPTVCTASPCP